MKKAEMLEYLGDHTHWFGHSKRYAVNIKLHSWNVSDKAWEIALNEDLSKELWFRLETLFADFQAEHGVKVYTGGRMGGWIYLDTPTLDEGASYAEMRAMYALYGKLKQLAEDMFAELNYLADNFEIVDEEYQTTHTRKVLVEKGEQ